MTSFLFLASLAALSRQLKAFTNRFEAKLRGSTPNGKLNSSHLLFWNGDCAEAVVPAAIVAAAPSPTCPRNFRRPLEDGLAALSCLGDCCSRSELGPSIGS